MRTTYNDILIYNHCTQTRRKSDFYKMYILYISHRIIVYVIIYQVFYSVRLIMIFGFRTLIITYGVRFLRTIFHSYKNICIIVLQYIIINRGNKVCRKSKKKMIKREIKLLLFFLR